MGAFLNRQIWIKIIQNYFPFLRKEKGEETLPPKRQRIEQAEEGVQRRRIPLHGRPLSESSQPNTTLETCKYINMFIYIHTRTYNTKIYKISIFLKSGFRLTERKRGEISNTSRRGRPSCRGWDTRAWWANKIPPLVNRRRESYEGEEAGKNRCDNVLVLLVSVQIRWFCTLSGS